MSHSKFRIHVQTSIVYLSQRELCPCMISVLICVWGPAVNLICLHVPCCIRHNCTWHVKVSSAPFVDQMIVCC